VQDQPALIVEGVLVRNVLVHVAVLLRGPGRVELLELETVVDDRLEQVERADRVRDHGLVWAMPGLADVGLRAEMEDVRLVGGVEQLSDEVVDRGLVREIRKVHLQLLAQRCDVVQRAARRRANERVDVRVELNERIGEVRAHEPVGAGDETRPPAEEVAEVPPEISNGVVRQVESCWSAFMQRCPPTSSPRVARSAAGAPSEAASLQASHM